MPPNFVHLHLHSEYSLVDSLVRIKPLVKSVAAADMPAIALTDQANLFALVKFYKAAEAAGIKPIIGVDAWLNNHNNPKQPFRLVLLAQNTIGYKNITNLVSQGYQQGQHLGIPLLEKSWIETSSNGIIALSGGRNGDIGQALLAGHADKAKTLLAYWSKLFPNRYYLELIRTMRPQEEEYLEQAVTLAIDTGVPVVATNDVRFLHAQDFTAHEARVCIHQGMVLNDAQRPKNYSAEQYLKSPEEMAILFSDLPEALENSIEIAKRCNLELSLGKNYLPQFPTPKGVELDAYLRQQAHTGLNQRLDQLNIPQHQAKYKARLDLELTTIIQMGFAGYFLIVADFIQWAKEHDIPVGPGRGSGAGSLVAYALKITDLDPLPYDLLFERFLNPERVSMPDFDVDFCMEGRDRVIEYVAERYGRDAVSQIITYGSMAAKGVVRDVGRVLGHPYGFVDQIAKLIPFEIGMTLQKALEDNAELRNRYETEEEVTTLIDMAQSLEGLARNAGKHAGGVVIAPGKLTDFTPLYCEANGEGLVTQFDKDDVEQVGLVKFDFLGLRTLTIIDWALQNINKTRKAQHKPIIEINALPLDDVRCFELLRRGDTTAVFQLESRGMKELIRKLKPDNFEDIIALVALYRPGPLGSGMVDDFINRKHGKAKVEYPHPSLETILKPTYGIILYQEQVMQIAQVLAGFSLGSADLLRRAMGKKVKEVMDKQRAGFIEGALAHGVTQETAGYIFDLMAEFAKYGFNKSHSAAYALLSYQTAWLKTHYPAAFMAAVLSADMDNTDKVVNFIEECRNMQLKIQPPDINKSEWGFTVENMHTLVYGLGAIKGIGAAAIDSILETRNRTGTFKDLFDFCCHVDTRKVNRRVLETMIRAGAMDGLGKNRATLMRQLSLAIKLAEQRLNTEQSGLTDMFSSDAETATNLIDPNTVPVTLEWDSDERLRGEKSTLGVYISGHPIDRFATELSQLTTNPIAKLLSNNSIPVRSGTRKQPSGHKVMVAGLVTEVHHRNTPKTGSMGSLILEDHTGRLDVVVFSEVYTNCHNLLNVDKILIINGILTHDEYRGQWSVRAEQIFTLEQIRERTVERVHMRIDGTGISAVNEFVTSLKDILTPYVGGKCLVAIEYQRADSVGLLRLGKTWYVHPNNQMLQGLKNLLGSDNVWLVHNQRSHKEA